MITIFDVFSFACAVGGGVLGWNVGHSVGGWIGAATGAALGAYVGLVVGRLPGALAVYWMRWSLRRRPTDDLRARLEPEYFIAHLIIAELLARGEALDSFRGFVNWQLESSSAHVRFYGKINARTWFPDLLSSPAGLMARNSRRRET
jgi:hypothetical protein